MREADLSTGHGTLGRAAIAALSERELSGPTRFDRFVYHPATPWVPYRPRSGPRRSPQLPHIPHPALPQRT
jgi:hypothetical protein